MRNFLWAAALIGTAAMATAPAWSAEATFERNLTVSGRVDLKVVTGSGSIHLTAGPAGRVHIFGRVRSTWGWGGGDQPVNEIAAHPPIEQTGNIVRVGVNQGNLHNISIDYEIEAPADAYLDAGTGSGSLTDDGVGTDARLHTGSGSIHATGLRDGFSLDTGSGSISAEATGNGDGKAETGSGSIELRGVDGGLRAHTGSGGIRVTGTPVGPWRLNTGSGSVELWTGNAGFTLDAHTGSGSIHSDRQIAMQGSLGRHHVMGSINGGGPTVSVGTGSGSIRIH
jgi:hypothetical protein